MMHAPAPAPITMKHAPATTMMHAPAAPAYSAAPMTMMHAPAAPAMTMMHAPATTMMHAPAMHYAAAPVAQVAQQAAVKQQIGQWMICHDAQGEFYQDSVTGQSYDHPPPQLLQLMGR